jgi:hypothetical protein
MIGIGPAQNLIAVLVSARIVITTFDSQIWRLPSVPGVILPIIHRTIAMAVTTGLRLFFRNCSRTERDNRTARPRRRQNLASPVEWQGDGGRACGLTAATSAAECGRIPALVPEISISRPL